MSGKKPHHSSVAKMTIGILVVLVGVNAVWAVTMELSGPVIALLFYAFVTFLCWRRSHFQAGIISGILGLGIHVYELIFQDLGRLDGFDLGLFYANIVLPIPLTYFSYQAHREVNRLIASNDKQEKS